MDQFKQIVNESNLILDPAQKKIYLLNIYTLSKNEHIERSKELVLAIQKESDALCRLKIIESAIKSQIP